MPRLLVRRWFSACALLLPLGAAPPSAARAREATAESLAWRREPVPGEAGPLHAVAVAADGRVAVGGERGVALRAPAGPWRRSPTRAAVQDLAFDARGGLWVATAAGLLHGAPNGALEHRTPAPGEQARAVRRIAVQGRRVAVATDADAFLSGDGRHWLRVEGGFARGEVRALTLAPGDAGATLWLATARGTFRVDQHAPSGAPLRAVAVELPVRRGETLDLLAAPSGDLVVLGRRTLQLRRAGRWSALRPALPPGATPRRLAWAAGRLWLATDRGLLEAPDVAGPWRRAGPPAGTAQVFALAAQPGRLWLATGEGLLLGTPAHAGAERTRPDALAPCAVPVLAVQRAALAHTGLDTPRDARLAQRVRRRALWPVVTLRAGAGRRSDRARDLDEAFSSGALRLLHDRERERTRDTELALTLTWDLGGVAYDPEEIDVSQELRRRIELRDDVLDEVNQLYFERRRLLAELAGLPAGSREAGRLRLRVAELAAGLDAWTGGWFDGARGAAPCPSSR